MELDLVKNTECAYKLGMVDLLTKTKMIKLTKVGKKKQGVHDGIITVIYGDTIAISFKVEHSKYIEYMLDKL